ncbi:MAG TPA: formyltransferase [Steroidobacteraceae bacterium]
MKRAVVFAYHDVGVRCLSVLLAHGIDVRLVLTHDDDPRENIWFASVAELAARHDLPCITPRDANAADNVARIAQLAPDYLFSFYYRLMLGPQLLALPRSGALNMHGSLLPQYRGRAPVNWAILNGETATGATLHHMALKPDAGPIVDQQSVPILPDDTALEVLRKVTYAAEVCLDRALPHLLDGSAAATPQDLARGSYFGGRRPADGIIDWAQPGKRIHDLVRAVAPPYPGATSTIGGAEWRILRTVRTPQIRSGSPAAGRPALFGRNARLYASCGDGEALRIIELEIDGARCEPAVLAERFASQPLPLPLRAARAPA